jgi:hypothetical protein
MNRKRNKSGILSVQDTPATGFGADPQEWTLGTGKRDPPVKRDSPSSVAQFAASKQAVKW